MKIRPKKLVTTGCFIVLLLLQISGSETKEFVDSHYPGEFDIMLGKGETGEVWGSRTQEIVIKAATTSIQCKTIEKEFNIQKKISEILKKQYMDLAVRICIPEPIEFIVNCSREQDRCLLKMQRILPMFERGTQKIVRLYLGEEQEEVPPLNQDSGKASYDQLVQVLTEYRRGSISKVCRDLGTLLGIIHFKLKLDGLDCELAIGRNTLESQKYKIYMIDFGAVNDLSGLFEDLKYERDSEKKNELKSNIVDMIVVAMTIEPSFPNPTRMGFKSFREGYLSIAREEGYGELGENILELFIQKQLLTTNLLLNFLINQRIYTKRYLNLNLNLRRIRRQKGFLKRKNPLTILNSWTAEYILKKIRENEYYISNETLKNILSMAINKAIEKTNEERRSLIGLEKVLFEKLTN